MDRMNGFLTSIGGILASYDANTALRRLREAGWAVLLVPVARLVVGLFGDGISWGTTAAIAGAATLLVPAVAADLVAAAVVCSHSWKRRSASTARRSLPSSTCHRQKPTTAGSSPSLPFSIPERAADTGPVTA